jgi:hypothetical protein
LFDTIQTIFGAPINQKAFRIWKGKEIPDLSTLSTYKLLPAGEKLILMLGMSLIPFFNSCQCSSESFQAATRELQRIYGKEGRNI